MDKRKRRIAAVVLALLSGGTVLAEGPRQPPTGIGVPYLIPRSAVRLDAGQREQLAAIRRALHQRYCQLSARLIDVQEELRAVLAEEQRGSQAAARLSREIDALRRQARAAHAGAEKRALALLTPEQRTVLAQWREGRRGEKGEIEDVPYTVLPGIESDESDIENLEDPELDPRY